MVSYIVDASVVVEFIIGGTYTSNARTLFLHSLEGDQFTVPDLCLAECTNVIWKMVRFHGMPSDQAITALRDLRALPLKRAATRYVLNTALAIGLKYSLAIYDSLYIALSQRTGNILVTIDSKQEQAARAEGVNLKRISEFV